MEQGKCEDCASSSSLDDGALQKKGENDSEDIVRPQNTMASEVFESKFESPTPEKPESRKSGGHVALARNLLVKDFQINSDDAFGTHSERTPVELPEAYKTLEMLFSGMDTSIRLLSLRRKMTTFNNICAQVKSLKNRKFTLSDLAQMKFLLPEAIHVKRILLHDKKSLCMYPELVITLSSDAIDCSLSDKFPSLVLCQAFHSRLQKYLMDHPGNIVIPEAILPVPLRAYDDMQQIALFNEQLNTAVIDDSTEQVFHNASHFPVSFKCSISKKMDIHSCERTYLAEEPVHKDIFFENLQSDVTRCCTEATPQKVCSEPRLAMTETPVLVTPRRPIPSPLEKSEANSDEPSEKRVTSSARKSLLHSLTTDVDNNQKDSDLLSNDLQFEETQALDDCLQFHDVPGSLLPEEVYPTADDNNLTMKCGNIGEQEEKTDSIPATFDVVCFLSRGRNTLITKQELVLKILTNNLEIEEPSEAEKQLSLLEELVPDWISRKVAESGEVLYSIKGIADEKSVRKRLVESL